MNGARGVYARLSRHAEKLATLLRSAAGVSAGTRFGFYTFLWEGDVSYWAFAAAERSAVKSGPHLASFISDLKSGAQPHISVIVITHSLGARTALESLNVGRRTTTTPLVDCLLMVPQYHGGAYLNTRGVGGTKILVQSNGPAEGITRVD